MTEADADDVAGGAAIVAIGGRNQVARDACVVIMCAIWGGGLDD